MRISLRILPLAGVLLGGVAGCSTERALPIDAGSIHWLRDGGAGRDAAADAASQCPPDVASTRQIRILVRNDASADRFLAMPSNVFSPTDGWCARFGVERADGSEVPIVPGFQCYCECPNPGSAYSDAYQRIAPGATVELDTWDGRGLVSCTVPLDCATQGWSGVGVIPTYEFASQPVASGAYHITVAVEQSPPNGCMTSDGTNYYCPPSGGVFGVPGPTEELCPSSETASADLIVPPTGDTSVVVSLH